MANKTFFGTLPDGRGVHSYEIGRGDLRAAVIDYGASLRSLCYLGREIIGGFDTLSGYLNDDSNQGRTVGRVANRIAGARFTLNGKEYKLPKNNGENCLHGGHGFGDRMWELDHHGEDSVSFSYVSRDGEEGFPARLEVRVTFTVVGSELRIDYEARPDGDTPIALTNHAYFNLDGLGGTILDHEAEIFADRYTAVNSSLIPTGERPEVRGTVFDFTSRHKIGERVGGDFAGYDHNYILSPREYRDFDGVRLGLGAIVRGRDTEMRMYTDQPGVQFYIANFLGGKPDFAGGVERVRHGAFCLEAQTEPDAPNRGECIYSAGECYRQTTVYSFKRL